MKTLAIASLAILLTACAATTPQQLRDTAAENHISFEVAADYQTVYRRVLEVERACYQVGMISATQIVNGDLYPDSRTGTITIGLYGALGPSIYQVVDVRGLDGSRTLVDAALPRKPNDTLVRKLKSWAEGTSTEC